MKEFTFDILQRETPNVGVRKIIIASKMHTALHKIGEQSRYILKIGTTIKIVKIENHIHHVNGNIRCFGCYKKSHPSVV